MLSSIAVQNTVSTGVRWDFHKNLDLKLQNDYIRLGANSPGILTNLQPDFRRGESLDLISLAIDFVF